MEIIKKIIFKILPDKILTYIKKYHYHLKLKNADPSDEEDLQMIQNLIKKNSDVIDIGANFGLYTKFLSKYVGTEGRVLSFEPIHETFNYLTNNILKLKLNHVTPFEIAVSDKKGKSMMQVPKFDEHRTNFYEAKIIEEPDHSLPNFEVETNTLDEICKQYNFKPSFIKCDVEGHEWSVFKGAPDVINLYKPLLLIEINHELTHTDVNTAELLDYLHKQGYQLFVNQNNRLKKWESEKKFNYYFLTEEHVKSLADFILN